MPCEAEKKLKTLLAQRALLCSSKNNAAAAAAAKSLQSCPTLRDPKDGSPPGSSIPGIQLVHLEVLNSSTAEV